MTNLLELSPKTRKAIKSYTAKTCVEAYVLSKSENVPTVRDRIGFSNRASTLAAINAGREIETGIQSCEFDDVFGTERRGNYYEGKTTLGKFLVGKKVSVTYIQNTHHRVTVSIEYATFTTFTATLSETQFASLVRSLPEGTEVSKF